MAMRALPTVPEEGDDLEQGFLVAQKGEEATPGCDRCLVASYCVGIPLCLGVGIGIILLFWWLVGYKP